MTWVATCDWGYLSNNPHCISDFGRSFKPGRPTPAWPLGLQVGDHHHHHHHHLQVRHRHCDARPWLLPHPWSSSPCSCFTCEMGVRSFSLCTGATNLRPTMLTTCKTHVNRPMLTISIARPNWSWGLSVWWLTGYCDTFPQSFPLSIWQHSSLYQQYNNI